MPDTIIRLVAEPAPIIRLVGHEAHSHPNKTLLDTYDQTNTDITDAVSKKHTHANSVALAAVTNTNTGDEDATSIAAILTAADEDDTPANANEFPYMVGGVLKRISYEDLKAAITAGISSGASYPAGTNGDGSDLDVVINAGVTVTLSRAMYYNTLENNGTIATNGWPIFILDAGENTATGIIHADGVAGVDSNPASGSGNTAPSVIVGIFIQPSPANGQASATGNSTNASSNSQFLYLGGNGGLAGKGGESSPRTSGTAGTQHASTVSRVIRHFAQPPFFGAISSNNLGTHLIGGTPGSSASGGAGNGTLVGGNGATGGLGGGILFISARYWTNNGIERAIGGAGGNSTTATNANAGNGGPGGGGGGGCIIERAETFSGSGTYDVSGGAAGSLAAVNGTASAATAATAGATGKHYRFDLNTGITTIT